MDPKVTQIPGKSLSSRLKFHRKASEAPKILAQEPPISRQKRVFGTVRTTNIPAKTVNEKPATKPMLGALQKQPKPSRLTQYAFNASAKPQIEANNQKFTEKLNPKPKKKSPGIRQPVKERALKDLHVDTVVEPQTPVVFPRLFKVKGAGTPYHTAEKCSKCRFDKMETSSYWLAQIKLAESVGKHFVSAAFFRLAYECNAEPIRNLRMELKHYLTRHQHLSAHTEWKDVCLSYGLLKDDCIVLGQNSCAETTMPEISSSELDKDQSEATEPSTPEINSRELVKDQTESIATESGMLQICGSESDKGQMVETNVGESETESSQIMQNSLCSEAR